MAYFDSAKNRTIWRAELESLRAEKQRRQQRGYQPQEVESLGYTQENNPHRIRITYRQLEEKLAAQRRLNAERRRMEGRPLSEERTLGEL